RGGEVGDVEVAGEIFDLDGDTGGDRDGRVVAQRHFGDAGVDRDSRRDSGVDLNCGSVGLRARDFQISGGADDADRFDSIDGRDSHGRITSDFYRLLTRLLCVVHSELRALRRA